MSQTFGQLNSTLTRALIKEGASQTQVGAFVTALEQVTDALESEEAAALMQSGVTKTLFTKALSGAVSHNRSPARPETDPEQSALFGALEAIESLLKRHTDLRQPHLEDALLKAGVVSVAKPLLDIMINRLDDVECREVAVSCLLGAAPREPAMHPLPPGHAQPPTRAPSVAWRAAEMLMSKKIKRSLLEKDLSDGAARSLPISCPRACGGVARTSRPPD